MHRPNHHACHWLHRHVVMVWFKALPAGAVLLIVLTGCAGVKKKFVPGTKANVGFFADSTIAMLSDVDTYIDRNEAVFTRRFFNEEDNEEKEMMRLSDNMQIAIGNIVAYSISLVTIAESQRPEKEKIETYADHLSKFKDDILYSTKMTPEQFDARIAEIKAEPDFISALRAAQPLLSAAVVEVIWELKELTNAVATVSDKIDTEIDAEYNDIIHYQAKMEDEKARILRAIEIVFDAYRTDKPNLKGLAETGSVWFPELIPRGRPTPNQLKAIGEHLRSRLDALHSIGQEIKPYWEEYRAAHRELDTLTDKTLQEISKVRLIMLVWIRAHQKMASGEADPAPWFDINTAPATLFRFGTGLL